MIKFECIKCDLHKYRNNIVYGSGSPLSKIIVISESAGYKEDRTGLAFSGQSGIYFKELMVSAGFNLSDIYFTTLIKCRIPVKRKPLKKEIRLCKTWLEDEVKEIKPLLIIYLGNTISSILIKENVKVSNKLLYKQKGIAYYFTYHPTYVLNNYEILHAYYLQQLTKLNTVYNTEINPPLTFSTF